MGPPVVRTDRARCTRVVHRPDGDAQRTTALVSIGARGHINADSGLDDWRQGHAMLASLTDSAAPPRAR